MPEGAERVLQMLVDSELPDEAWLRSIAAFGELNTRPKRGAIEHGADAGVIALILLTPSSLSDDESPDRGTLPQLVTGA